MEQKQDLAIVLKWAPFEDRHRVVTALTEHHGRISALARNSIQSRRFGGALEPFSAAEWRFVERPGANLYRVEEASIRRSYEGLRKDFERLSVASFFNELMLKVAPEREPCPELFRIHANALAVLDEMGQPFDEAASLSLINAYIAKLLQWSGNQPQVGQCLGCQKPLENLELHLAISCVVADAGWVCPECRILETRHVRDRQGQGFQHSMLRVTPAALRDFHLSLGAPIRQIPSLVVASQNEHLALFKFLEGLLIYHVPGFHSTAMKTLKFLNLDSNISAPTTTSLSSRYSPREGSF